ncbi:hypothetical protein KKC83_02990 [Patescibacteria group bacterium]|nr:hypothetical protein [Candidatus Falkowbacteria bacterium]MBU3905707.1 hypothetical protein [Patescibacteria group bacterium]MCG2698100.1 hypothetical protein [Candidatus Parcubacteria bacterium]MBU4014863.1 hypothetical protein [Patescibacteria group bacterium]MBU4026481.1 hypothetical protein [Patescibacteria group bacterium]
MKKKYLEIFFDKCTFSAEDIVSLAEEVRKNFTEIRIVPSSVYSYQGGEHGSNPPKTRPDDWSGVIPRISDGDTRDGDYLLCLGTEDRYGYVDERGLVYKKASSIEEAKKFLKGVNNAKT